MLQIYSDTKIYVHAPAGVTTGGVELLHQLVDFLRRNGKIAYVVYYGIGEHVIPDEYAEYNIEVVEEELVENSSHHVEIYTETMPGLLLKNTKCTQKFLWWLSVDNYYCNYDELCLRDIFAWNREAGKRFMIYRLRRFLHGYNDFRGKISLSKLLEKSTCCGYQSEYIKRFLLKNGFKKIVPLFDYINTDYTSNISLADKEDIVLYNPSKGYEFTKQLIALAPDIKWVALKGYTRVQLIGLLRKSKLYIDFGNHPGKDRLPRECAINGCCIITGKQGSAAFYEDVSISDDYKFDETIVEKNIIIEKIRRILDHYEYATNDFQEYRYRIVREKENFEKQIKCLFFP